MVMVDLPHLQLLLLNEYWPRPHRFVFFGGKTYLQKKLHKTNRLILRAITIGCIVCGCGWFKASTAALERLFCYYYGDGGTDTDVR